MDCAAEEQLVLMALHEASNVRRVDVDLQARHVDVVHSGAVESIEALLRPLGLDARLVGVAPTADDEHPASASREEAGTLKTVLAINAGMFAAEAITGYLAESAALLADSLDMFADAAVYGIALYGAARSSLGQMKAARLSGYLQLALAAGALVEVARRAVAGSEPDPPLMGFVAVAALAANATCMWLLARHRKGGVHMKASWIFTTNDVIANIGVVVAAALVATTGSPLPDLVVGAAIGVVVLTGAARILRLSSTSRSM